MEDRGILPSVGLLAPLSGVGGTGTAGRLGALDDRPYTVMGLKCTGFFLWRVRRE